MKNLSALIIFSFFMIAAQGCSSSSDLTDLRHRANESTTCDQPTTHTGFTLEVSECQGSEFFYLKNVAKDVYIPITFRIINIPVASRTDIDHSSFTVHSLDSKVPLQEQETLTQIDYETAIISCCILHAHHSAYDNSNCPDTQINDKAVKAEIAKLE